MQEAINHLQQLGFSQYEAQAYTTLLGQNPLNGYELAKASGIPRANIYPVLQKLEERGAVLRLDTPEGARYTPTAPAELLARLKNRYQSAVDTLGQSLSEMAAPVTQEPVLNLRGYPLFLEQARALIAAARRYLLLSLWPEEAAALSEPMRQAGERGLEITTLCLRGCPKPCPACQGHVFRYPIAPSGDRRWLLLVSDDAELLAGEVTPRQEALAVRTRQKMLVNLTAGYIQNSIALASILNNLGDQPELTHNPQIRAAFDALHPMQEQPGQARWIDIMRAVIHNPENDEIPHNQEKPNE